MDFFVITRNINRFRRKKIDSFFYDLGKSCCWEFGVDVDFSAAKTMRGLQKVAPTMMWQELRAGHKMIYGSEDVFKALPFCDLNDLPLEESLRLLLNRGVGLFWLRSALQKIILLLTTVTLQDGIYLKRLWHVEMLLYY